MCQLLDGRNMSNRSKLKEIEYKTPKIKLRYDLSVLVKEEIKLQCMSLYAFKYFYGERKQDSHTTFCETNRLARH